jgi:hypothetical protein
MTVGRRCWRKCLLFEEYSPMLNSSSKTIQGQSCPRARQCAAPRRKTLAPGSRLKLNDAVSMYFPRSAAHSIPLVRRLTIETGAV